MAASLAEGRNAQLSSDSGNVEVPSVAEGRDAQSDADAGKEETVAPYPDVDASVWDATPDVIEPSDVKDAAPSMPLICTGIWYQDTWSQVMDSGSLWQYTWNEYYELMVGCGYGVALSGMPDASWRTYYDLDSGQFVGGEYVASDLDPNCKAKWGVVPEGGLDSCNASWVRLFDDSGGADGSDAEP